jgi:hypothetical protein
MRLLTLWNWNYDCMSGYTVYYTYSSVSTITKAQNISPVLSFPFPWSTPEELKAYLSVSPSLDWCGRDVLDKRWFGVWSLVSNVDDHWDPTYCDHRLLLVLHPGTVKKGWLTFAILSISSFQSSRCNKLALTLMLRWTYLLFRLRMPLYVYGWCTIRYREWLSSIIIKAYQFWFLATSCTSSDRIYTLHLHPRLSRSLVR